MTLVHAPFFFALTVDWQPAEGTALRPRVNGRAVRGEPHGGRSGHAPPRARDDGGPAKGPDPLMANQRHPDHLRHSKRLTSLEVVESHTVIGGEVSRLGGTSASSHGGRDQTRTSPARTRRSASTGTSPTRASPRSTRARQVASVE